MDIDEDRLIGDAAFGEGEARDHRVVRGRRVIEAWLGGASLVHGAGDRCVLIATIRSNINFL
jgi:hypothetical protein